MFPIGNRKYDSLVREDEHELVIQYMKAQTMIAPTSDDEHQLGYRHPLEISKLAEHKHPNTPLAENNVVASKG